MPEQTRRSARAAAEASSRATTKARKPRRPLLKSFRLWVPVGVLALLVVVGVAGVKTADRAFAARDALEQAMPLAATAKTQVLDGDLEQAQQTIDELKVYTANARVLADGRLWRLAEVVPFVGNNLAAVRTIAGVVDDLTVNAVEPAAHVDVAGLAPVDGHIDTAAVTEVAATVDYVAATVDDARARLAAIDRAGLIGQVDGGLTDLDGMIAQLQSFTGPARTTLNLLPAMLGADGPRNYLVLVQNNAESRGTGGNPASVLMLHVEDGAMAITQQASSSDFHNNRETPIIELDPETVALYTDKVGRFMQDVTTTVDFPESARLIGAFWAESFGTPVDGTLSIDPVALSYLLAATGPVTLPDGDVLTTDNAVAKLLNEVYFRYPTNTLQDAYFAAAAGTIFEALTSVQDARALVPEFARAIDEGRILYAPGDEAEAAAISGSRISGRLPADNGAVTMVGSYVNDITEGKLDYYVDTAITVASDVCTVDAATAPTFTVDTTLTYTLQPDEVAGLAKYISPARFFPKGQISTDLVVYGPVGAAYASARVDGIDVGVTPVTHLGRPAVKINVISDPATVHDVSVTFTGVAGQAYGPLEAWHTPMVRETPVTIDAPECAAAG